MRGRTIILRQVRIVPVEAIVVDIRDRDRTVRCDFYTCENLAQGNIIGACI